MLTRTLLARAVLPIACAALVPPAFAGADAKPKYSAEVSAGVLADSDVGLAEIDQTTRQGDLAGVIGLKLDTELKPVKKLTLRAGYELSDTRYEEFDAFDLQTHRLSAEGEYSFGATTAGVMYNYVDARLDGDGYLTFQQASPYVTHLFNPSFLLRGAYVRSDRDFDTETGRNSTSDELQADGFFLLDGTRRYFVLGGKGGRTDADDEAFSYDNTGLKGRYVQRAALAGRDVKLRLGADFEVRDYAANAPGLDVPRKDETAAATAGMQVQLVGPLSVDVNYEYRQRASNVTAADFEENLGTVQLKLNF